jgi:hypothetical protein
VIVHGPRLPDDPDHPAPSGTPAPRPTSPPRPREPAEPAIPGQGGKLKLIGSKPGEPGLDVDEAWIADLSDVGRQIPRPIT